jgi:biopolymer transport protein ExbD
MLKKSFIPKTGKNEQMELQITSMADIFVIILVFLLKSYSVEGIAYEPTLGLNPPVAKGRVEASEALRLEVSEKGLALGGKTVLSMNSFKFGDIDSDGASRSLRKILAQARPGVVAGDKGAKIMVVADEGAPYETIKAVLASAANEGFLDVQLAVSHAE